MFYRRTKKVKKIILLCVALVAMLALVACGDDDSSKSDDKNDAASESSKKMSDKDNFENVTWSYEVVFEGETEVNEMTIKFTKDKIAAVEESGHDEVCPEEYNEMMRNSYINVVSEMAKAFEGKEYKKDGSTLTYNDEISFDTVVSIMGGEEVVDINANIKMTNTVIKLNSDGLMEEMECDVVQEYDANGTTGTIAFHGVFKFSDYGKTVITE